MSRLKSLGFYQDKIKRLNAFLSKIAVERKTMSVEGGGPGGIGGGVGAGVSVGPSISAGPSMSVGIEAGGLGSSLGPGLEFGSKMGIADISPIVNEGPFRGGVADFNPIRSAAPDLGGMRVPLEQFNVVSQAEAVAAQAWNLPAKSVVAEAEEIFFQAQKREFNETSFLSLRDHEVAKQSSSENNLTQITASPPTATQLRADPRNDELIDFGVRRWAFPQVEPIVLPFPTPKILEFPKAVASPALEPAVKTKLQTTTEPAVEVKQETLVQPALEEQVVEKAVTERVTVEKIDTVGEEKIIKKKKFVVDQTTLANRLQKVVEAARQAKPEAERLGLGKKIIGWIVDKYLFLSHPSYMSKAVQPEGPDGTIAITEETIKAKTEFESEQEVESVVLDNIPVSEEEDGEPVSDEQVRKVFQDRIVKPSKPGRPLELVEKRVVQKEQKSLRQPVVFTVVNEQTEAKKENNLRDLGLAEIFPKAT